MERPVIPDDPSHTTIFGHWCRVTAYHGVVDFHTSRAPLAKLAWLSILIFGGFLAANQSVGLVLDFIMESQWITVTSTEMAPSATRIWPNMLICEVSPEHVRRSVLHGRLRLYNPYQIAYHFRGQLGVQFHDRFQADSSGDLNMSQFNKTEGVFDEWTYQIRPGVPRPDCDSLLVDCGRGVGQLSSSLNQNCCHWFMESLFRHCVKINLTEMKQSIRAEGIGYENGIFFVLNPGLDDNYENVLPLGPHPTAGLHLSLYFGEEEEDGMVSPIALQPGTHALVAMTMEKRRVRLRKPRNIMFSKKQTHCANEMKYRWFETDTPSIRLCQFDCQVQFCWELFHCQLVSYSSHSKKVNGLNSCNREDTEECAKRSFWTLESGESVSNGFNISECYDQCKEPCEFDVIRWSVSTSLFPSPNQLRSYTTYLNRIPSPDRPRFNFTQNQVRQFILLSMFYETREYFLIERVDRSSVDELISNVGGALGAWTGISVISLLQALVYAGRGLRNLIRRMMIVEET